MSLQLTEETNSIFEKHKSEGGTSDLLGGLGRTGGKDDIPIIPILLNLDKRGIVASQDNFLKLIRSDKTDWLINEFPNAFLLLCVIALRAKRAKDELRGLEPGDSIVDRRGTSKAAGLTEMAFRIALEKLIILKFIEVVWNPKVRGPQKRTIKTSMKSMVVNILDSDVFDINKFHSNHQDNHPTTHEQPKTRKNKKEQEVRKSKLFLSDSFEIGLAELLFSKISAFLESPKIPNFQNWAIQVDLMIRVDKRDPEDIRKMVEWLYSSGPIFWRKNILSTAKLRDKWDRLKAELKAPNQFQNAQVDRRQRLPDGTLANGGEDLF